MDLNVIRKSPIFLGQVTKYSLRNRPYEALKRGLARGQVTSIISSPERMRKNWGWASSNRPLTPFPKMGRFPSLQGDKKRPLKGRPT
jgi:hypothetical protein